MFEFLCEDEIIDPYCVQQSKIIYSKCMCAMEVLFLFCCSLIQYDKAVGVTFTLTQLCLFRWVTTQHPELFPAIIKILYDLAFKMLKVPFAVLFG